MVTALGYVAYAFICIFNPLQFFFMLRHKTVNLGAWPMVSLVLGLTLLCISFWYVAVPTYVIVGTAVSLIGCAANLLLLLLRRPATNPMLTPMRQYEKSILGLAIPEAFFCRGGSGTPTGRTPTRRRNAVNFTSEAPMRTVEPPPYVEKYRLQDCKTCGCLLYEERSIPVEICVNNVDIYVVCEGRDMPFDSFAHPVRCDFYCKRDRPAYDQMVIHPSPYEGGVTAIEYFKRTMSDAEYANMKEAHGATFRPTRPYRQVTVDGEPYD